MCTKTPKQVEAVKKEMCKIFKKHNLQITIEADKTVVDFLDLTLDLRTGVYKPYKKPNNNIAYIHKQSNHPPSIIKNLLKGINKRLSTNSNNAQTFKEALPPLHYFPSFLLQCVVKTIHILYIPYTVFQVFLLQGRHGDN